MGAPAKPTARAILTAQATRAAFARRWVVALFFLIAGLYAFASMLLGGMLVFARTGATSTSVFVITAGIPWWNYPAVLVTFPGGSLALPFFPTISMILVSIGVGVGMSVAAVIASRLIALRRASAGRPLAAGSIAGLTPAILALVTMGACCTTTAASAAGLGVVAQTTGTTVDTLLANDWYLGVFQLVVVGVALLAQEAILVAYGPLLGLSAPDEERTSNVAPLKARDFARYGVRAFLIGAAAFWSLWAFSAQFTAGAALTSAAAWAGFVVEHLVVSSLVISFALYPEAFRDLLDPRRIGKAALALRALFFAVGVWVLAWVPAGWAGPQTAGLVNVIFGIAGLSPAWGAVAPTFTLPVALALQLSGGFLLLGALSVLLALRSSSTVDWFVAAPIVPTPGRSPAPRSEGRAAPGLPSLVTSSRGQSSGTAGKRAPREVMVETYPLSGSEVSDPGLRLGDADGP